ncbi:MAG: DAK2 domain-containing protein, partial [Hungatella sp.]
LTVGKSIQDTALDTLKLMLDADSELISIYYGTDITDAEADALRAMVQTACPDCEIEVHSGGQPIYYYLISVE